mmetsp:Transcript_1936/g.4790  ORF Transcript_1936/g.4790 Transcript_1936/m.4790 type:complete len:101 (-) Transcript_1936:144-446(-)
MIADEGSSAMKRPMPSLSADDVVIDACWSKDTGAMAEDDAAGCGESITATDRRVVSRRVRGVTNPETHAAIERNCRMIRQEFFIMAFGSSSLLGRGVDYV